MSALKTYLLALVTFLALDFIWLGLLAGPFYQHQIGYLLNSNPNWLAVFFFYLLFVAGLVYFVIQPGIKHPKTNKTFVSALFFGLVTYATYDLTNLATIKNWPISITFVDLLWGSVLSLSTTFLTIKLYKFIK